MNNISVNNNNNNNNINNNLFKLEGIWSWPYLYINYMSLTHDPPLKSNGGEGTCGIKESIESEL